MRMCASLYLHSRVCVCEMRSRQVWASPFLSAGNKNMECPPDPFIERVETAAKSRTGSIDLEATVLLAITAKAI